MNVCMLQILFFDSINVSQGINVSKTSGSKECDIYHYWYFSTYSFKLQPSVCNRCHNLLIMTMSLSDIAILNIKGSDYCCYNLISKKL